jgi:phosphate transport system protein
MDQIALHRHTYRNAFEEILQAVVRMGAAVNNLVRMSTEAALTGDLGQIDAVISGDDEVDAYEQEIFKKTVAMVLKETPVAQEYRALVATLGVVGEIERAADDAVKLARRAKKLRGQFPAEMRVPLMELGEEARRVFSGALRLYTEYSSDLADEIIAADEEIDTRYTAARARVIDMIRANPENSEHLVRTIDAFHALEHVADHGVEIARRLKMLNR